jgi:hypothetical protein
MIASMLAIIIGERGSLTRSTAQQRARLLAIVIQRQPDEIIDLAVAGYDDDPRELWEIAESRDYLIAFAEALTQYGIALERLLPQSQTLIKVCQLAAAGIPVTAIGNYEDTIRESVDAILHRSRTTH